MVAARAWVARPCLAGSPVATHRPERVLRVVPLAVLRDVLAVQRDTFAKFQRLDPS